jgi:hypothetical protein
LLAIVETQAACVPVNENVALLPAAVAKLTEPLRGPGGLALWAAARARLAPTNREKNEKTTERITKRRIGSPQTDPVTTT